MDFIRCRAFAKLNLTLDVLGKRDDGYHEIETVMQTVRLFDEISIRKTDKASVEIKCSLGFLPADERNLAVKAALAVREKHGIKTGVRIDLLKRIPVSAGFAGGSSDAAAVLLGMNRLFRLNMKEEELYGLALSLGADVPFCIFGGSSVARGIGEKLERIPCSPSFDIVIARPPVAVSTAEVYKNYDEAVPVKRPDTKAMCDALCENDAKRAGKLLCNVLESVTESKLPVIGNIKELMLENGAEGALMTGSGPGVFGIFSGPEAALSAAGAIKEKLGIKDVFTTKLCCGKEKI